MFLLFVYFVSMNLLMIRTEVNIVRIDIKKGTSQLPSCDVITSDVTLVKGSNFSLEVRSDYFIKRSFWKQTLKNLDHQLQELNDSKFSITYERSISSENEQINTFTYKYSHTQKVVDVRSGGTWNFRFEYLKNYDPWTSNVGQNQDFETCNCSTSVQTNPPSLKSRNNPTSDSDSGSGTGTPGKDIPGHTWLIAGVSLFGILFLVQSSVILYGKARKARSRKSKKNNDEDPISPKSPKTKRGAKSTKNIADRPPLPLPPDEVVKEDKFKMEPKTSPPMSPVPKRHHLFPQASAPPMPVENAYHHAGPLVPKQSYSNKGLVTSDEGIKSPAFVRRPMEGPLVPKQSYRNKELNTSDEDIRRPGFPRKRMEGPLVPKQSYRNKPSDSSDEELSPGFPRRQMEGPYRNKALENSHEELRSPGFPRRQEGPLVQKPSYRNKSLDHSEDELKTPGFARRQIEAKLAQLPPKAVTASKSFKLPKPLPRSPPSPPPPERAPVFHPAQRKEPAPSVHPKKLPVFPPPAACRQTDPRLSDVDWQYEKLEPASKYLNNFSDVPYDNMM